MKKFPAVSLAMLISLLLMAPAGAAIQPDDGSWTWLDGSESGATQQQATVDQEEETQDDDESDIGW
ncbi:MAG TPA: hypothetical protein ENK54_04840 [Thiotrichales bacterium]|nr:hypothetical protein [Thiotrichales bacterium]